eukprot:TRINITY_DN3059_c0_g3_i1.p1 TRINITY_DN3059_c0_g3~~TRINITY_DN3059_c0_g3_i1.p1  ORF type:complete len:647 (+),score=188.11 TRINITY_DN3059_c0_g3_i1:169-2109(+)
METEKKQTNLFFKSMTLFDKKLFAASEPGAFDLFKHVYAGELTAIVDHVNLANDPSEAEYLVSCKDDDNGKYALDLACYLGFRNIALYLLSLGADAGRTDDKGRNVFHTVGYRGEYGCAVVLQNYRRYVEMRGLYESLTAKKQQYKFKNLDVDHGKLVTTILHDEDAKERFEKFHEEIQELLKEYCAKILEEASNVLCQQDIYGKNPIHYGAQSTYTRCFNVVSILLAIHLRKAEGFDQFFKLFDEVQLLEVRPERKADPRKYVNVVDEFEHLLSAEVYKKILHEFHSNVKALQRRILNMEDNEGNTPLHIASYSGDFLATEHFLRLGASSTAANSRKQMPLDIAKNSLVRKILSSLNKAAYESDVHNLKYLVNCGCKIDGKVSIFGEAPIHQSIKSSKASNSETLKAVLDCGADVNLIDNNGWTALHHAAEKGDLNAAKILIEYKANVNAFSNARKTPLHLAAFANKTEMVKLLIANGADIEFASEDKCTPLHYAAKKGSLECVKVLLNAKAAICKQDRRLWTPLHYAAYNGHKKVVNFLLYWDADYEKLRLMRNSQNKKAEEIVTDPDVKFSFNLIWKAAAEGNLDMVRILHREGQSLDQQTWFKKNTALHLAVMNRHNLIIRYLIESGASTSIQNSGTCSTKQ